jgi:hypothetical protein
VSYPSGMDVWWRRIGVHHNWVPDELEAAQLARDPHTVTCDLFALGSKSPLHVVDLWNPDLAQDGPPPPFPGVGVRQPGQHKQNNQDQPRSNRKRKWPQAFAFRKTPDQDDEGYDIDRSIKPPKNPSLVPWQLKSLGPTYANARGDTEKVPVYSTAISPRGAHWIVAVGVRMSFFVFKLGG